MKIGLNIETPYYSMPSLMFGDLMMGCSPAWDKKYNPVINFDGKWPTNIPSGSQVSYIPAISGYNRKGDHILTAEGSGSFNFRSPSINQNFVFDGKNNSPQILTFPEKLGETLLNISATDQNNPLKNIKIQSPGSDPEKLFHPDFISSHTGFNTLRFMDFQQINNSKEMEWSDRNTREGYNLEALIEICNQTNSNAWICIPHLASDDYVTQMAKLVGSKLNPLLKVYLEFSNEVWNWGFKQAQDNLAKSKLSGLPYEVQYLRTANKVQDIWAAANTTNKLIRVMAWQFSNSFELTQRLAPMIKVYGVKFDAFAVAPYFSIKYGFTGILSDLIANGKIEAAKNFAIDASQRNIEIDFISDMTAWSNAAKSFGVPLIAYECGPGLSSSKDPIVQNFLNELHCDDRMSALIFRLFQVMNSYFDLACYFTNITTYNIYGSWGARENIDDLSPKWIALKSYAAISKS